MADIQHSGMTSIQCHEPKHITNTLTSQSGMVITPSSTTAGTSELRRLVASDIDIAGSTSPFSEYATYADTVYTSGSPLSVVADTRTKVTIDGLGPETDESTLPPSVSFWDTIGNEMTPQYETDSYNVRLTFKASTTPANAFVDVDLDIGGATGVILQETKPLLRASSGTNWVTVTWPLYTGSIFVANGGEFYITPNEDTDFWDFGIYISRTRKGGTS